MKQSVLAIALAISLSGAAFAGVATTGGLKGVIVESVVEAAVELIADGLFEGWFSQGDEEAIEDFKQRQADCQDLSVALDNLGAALADARSDEAAACDGDEASTSGDEQGDEATSGTGGQLHDPSGPGSEGAFDGRLWGDQPIRTDCELQRDRVADLEVDEALARGEFARLRCEDLLGDLPTSPQGS